MIIDIVTWAFVTLMGIVIGLTIGEIMWNKRGRL